MEILSPLGRNLYGKGGKDQGGAASSRDGERGRETNGGPYPMQSHVLSELLFRYSENVSSFCTVPIIYHGQWILQVIYFLCQINLLPSDTPVILSLVTPKRGSLMNILQTPRRYCTYFHLYTEEHGVAYSNCSIISFAPIIFPLFYTEEHGVTYFHLFPICDHICD